MIRIALVLAALALAGCGNGAQVPVTPAAETPAPAPPQPLPAPTCPHWALKPGWQHYRIGRGRARFNRETWTFDVDMASITWGETNRNTNIPYQNAYGAGVARVYSPEGVVVATVPDKLGASLLERLDSTGTYIGEAGSYQGPDCNEPEPMVPVNPVVGQVLRVTSIAERWDGVKFPFESECRVTAVGVDFDGFTNCVVTTLVENPHAEITAQTVFVNVFDGELAVQIHGALDGSGNADVIYARRVAQGDV